MILIIQLLGKLFCYIERTVPLKHTARSYCRVSKLINFEFYMNFTVYSLVRRLWETTNTECLKLCSWAFNEPDLQSE